MTARAILPRVDGRRLLERLRALAAITATPGRGVTRLAYSAEDVTARELVARWMREAGLAVAVDPAGNVVGTRAGAEPGLRRLATGSHLDTVAEAGALDGAYGVVAAVEVAAALTAARIRLRHQLAVVGFSNEEGARGTPGMVGSAAIAGHEVDLSIVDDEGWVLADRIAAAGGDPARLADAAWPPLAGFLELHVEQGPVLEEAGVSVGVVTAITARLTLDILIRGRAQHAGTTPMAARRDAAVAAARMVLAVHGLATEGAVRVATAGRVEVRPGVRNVVPGDALVGVDLRDVDDAALARAVDLLRSAAAEVAAGTGTDVDVLVRSRVPAVPTDPALAGCVASAADRLGLSRLALPSGAGHDAQVLAALGPVAMAFVPSIGGVSHAADEATADADLVAGADLLLHAVLDADDLLDGPARPERSAADPVGAALVPPGARSCRNGERGR
ncbi:MAG TPA: hydantoinase/carbamoylase family amidase [Mycobacteriales bacterium]|nr:hydantoinase/carbamoylase family amidase [Mycobacteriales bacterium]